MAKFISVPARVGPIMITEHTVTSLTFMWDSVQSATSYQILITNETDHVIYEVLQACIF